MFNPFLNLDDLTISQIESKMYDLQGKIASAKIMQMNPAIIDSMKISMETMQEELYRRRELKSHEKSKEKDTSCVFDVESYLNKNREDNESKNDNSRNKNYKPGW